MQSWTAARCYQPNLTPLRESILLFPSPKRLIYGVVIRNNRFRRSAWTRNSRNSLMPWEEVL
jgi:hypothetical protein